MNYQEAIHFIHGRPRLHRSRELTEIKEFLAAIGHPEQQGHFIHVTGTNGKGSVAEMVTEILLASGLRVGRFVSPFITRFNERIQVDGHNISDTDLADTTTYLANVLRHIQAERPDFALTEFEFVTALGFYYFAQRRVAVAVIEVGIGGAHDKTNVITPDVSAITTIGADHLELIGPTLDDVAAEKAGVIKKGVPVVVGEIAAPQLAIIKAYALREHAPLFHFGEAFQLLHPRLQPAQHRWLFDFANEVAGMHYKNIALPSISAYEVHNAATAIQVAVLYFAQNHGQLSEGAIREGMANFHWPARMELLHEKPFVLLDGAHNVPAVRALIDSVQQAFPGVTVHLIASFLQGKDAKKMLQYYIRAGFDIVGTDFKDPRLLPLAQWPEMPQPIRHIHDWRAALAVVLQETDEDDLIIIAGSLHFVSTVRESLLGGDDDDV